MKVSAFCRAALAALSLAGGLAPLGFGNEVSRQSDAKAQLKHASSLKKGVRGLQGEERREYLKEVAEAYSAVVRFFPEALPECSEASFRLGEIRRSLKDREGALIAFEKAVELRGDRRFGARAQIEIGHLHRRAKRLAEAASSYEKAIRDYSDLADTKDTALLWLGKARFALKDPGAARSAWKEVAEKSQDALDRIRAYDLIAGSFLSESNQAEAAATVERCQHALAAAADEPSAKGASVKRALERMKTLAKLNPSVADAGDDDGDEEG